ncbi:RpiA [Schleiferilactobacillus shenzhenensis LY-73]|uniref:Ribose-5-phosphate isomerase A n=2 Tax=Schleiferilactobacillus shenzhenensis TaxID=1231337 RepID=U4TIA3_9LACO|nr:RpiA [Schleiferilactobacillus shenzhenensis LY-73]
MYTKGTFKEVIAMLSQLDQNTMKERAARQAADTVWNGARLGVGTGSTVKFFIDALGERKAAGLQLGAVVTTSSRSKAQLEGLGFTVSELADVEQLDLTVDGADRVDSHLDGIKGGGGALTLEKNVAVHSAHNTWIVDESKVVDHLGGFPLPVEVLPISAKQVYNQFEDEGLLPQFRTTATGERYVTHYGNYIIDLYIDPLPAPRGLATYLDSTVGVVEHGLFLGICDTVIIAREDGTIDVKKR